MDVESQYYIKIITLVSCSYSQAAIDLINNHKIPHKIISVDDPNKNIYKNNLIDTFPQIYLNKHGVKGNMLLGGYDDLKYSLDIFKRNKYSEKNVNIFMNKYKWSKKATLRFIQLLN